MKRAHACIIDAVYTDATVSVVARSRRRRPGKTPQHAPQKPAQPQKAPGARIARVSVDDETWTAFRELCGSSPASIRLGELVRADVQQASGSPGADAGAAIDAIRAQLDALEALLVARGGDLSPPSR
jgi:hypothetical protein